MNEQTKKNTCQKAFNFSLTRFNAKRTNSILNIMINANVCAGVKEFLFRWSTGNEHIVNSDDGISLHAFISATNAQKTTFILQLQIINVPGFDVHLFAVVGIYRVVSIRCVHDDCEVCVYMHVHRAVYGNGMVAKFELFGENLYMHVACIWIVQLFLVNKPLHKSCL